MEIAQHVQPVIDRHSDDVLAQRQPRAVVADRTASALIETAAMEPDHYGTLAPVIDAASPDVEVETVFAGVASVRRPEDGEELALLLAAWAVRLRGVMAEFKGVAHSGPRFGRFWRHEAIRAAGRSPVRYPFEDLQAILFPPTHLARLDRHYRSHSIRRIVIPRSKQVGDENGAGRHPSEFRCRRQEGTAIQRAAFAFVISVCGHCSLSLFLRPWRGENPLNAASETARRNRAAP